MGDALFLTLLVGTLLVLALAAYALYVWRKVWQQRKQLENHQQEVASKLAGDLKILCGSLLDEQMPWIEGCIRLKVILEHYNFELSHDEAYSVFQEVFFATEHIPTHEAWKALDKAERRKHEETFAVLEEQYRTRSFTAARQLLIQLGEPARAGAGATVQAWSPAGKDEPAKHTLH